ncbi:unnamed protein product [Clonostachys solani]|uniref:Uncharacterized protein n=1 Tax=Clonostachys solani TaxID=160281 RepID=A0A9N9ZI61_9HYPO|nr:unnamed protein product [Clonostachys solani]
MRCGEEFAVIEFDDGECVICILELGKVFEFDNSADCKDLLHLVLIANLQQPSSSVNVVDASVKEDASRFGCVFHKLIGGCIWPSTDVLGTVTLLKM